MLAGEHSQSGTTILRSDGTFGPHQFDGDI